MGPPNPMPRIEPSRYNWRPSTKTQNLHLRRALGVEKRFSLDASGPRQLFLGGKLTLTGPYSALSLEVFGKAAECAWLRVRCEFPEVVLRPSSEQWDDGSILFELKIPGSNGEAREWMGRSLYLGICEEGKSAEEEMRQAVIVDPVCMRLNARVDQESKVAGGEFAFRMDHATVDGVGAYIVVANFLKFLAHAIGGRAETFDWAALNGKLPMPWVGMMNADQKTEGEEFEDGVKNLTGRVIEASKSEWGMKVLSKDEYAPEAIHKRFSIEESNAILLAVKNKLGKACSVTHLGHAAMVMTMLRFKPAQERPAHDARLVSLLFINGRRYLDQSFPGSRKYINLCRAINVIDLRDVETYVLSDKPTEKEVQEKLRLACADVAKSYQVVRDQTSLLTESFPLAEYVPMAKNDSKAVKSKGTADAYFVNDGLVERHVSASYYDEPQTHKVLEVDDLQFTGSPNGPSLSIRVSTFRHAIKLSVEWNGACFVHEDIRKYLESVADLMLSLTRDEIA